MDHQRPLPQYNPLYEFNRQTLYPQNRQAPYTKTQQTLYPMNPQEQYANPQRAPHPGYQPAQYATGQRAPNPTGQQSPYPPITQSPYPPSTRSPYPPTTQAPYPANSQPAYPPNNQPTYSRSQQTPYPTSQLPTPYPIPDSPSLTTDSDVELLGRCSGDEDTEQQPEEPIRQSPEPEGQSEEPAEPIEPVEPAESEEPEELEDPAPALTLDERSRVTKPPNYRPRKRVHGDFHELPPEGVDLSRLHEPSFQPRDHLPPPERVYNSFDETITAVTTFGKAHGIVYNKHKWSRNMRQRLMMVCSRAGVHRDTHKEGTKRRNMAANASKKCECRMAFWVLAMDYTNLEGQWRVKWCNDRKSIIHNHPPDRPKARDVIVSTKPPARIPGVKIA